MTQGLSDAALPSPDANRRRPRRGHRRRQWLWSKAAAIAGGTWQLQRDIIAGRILGLPR